MCSPSARGPTKEDYELLDRPFGDLTPDERCRAERAQHVREYFENLGKDGRND